MKIRCPRKKTYLQYSECLIIWHPSSQLIRCRDCELSIIKLNYVAKYSSSPINYPLKPVGLSSIHCISSLKTFKRVDHNSENWMHIYMTCCNYIVLNVCAIHIFLVPCFGFYLTLFVYFVSFNLCLYCRQIYY